MKGKQIAVLGAGGWGIAIANLLAEKGFSVNLWEFDKAAAESLKTTRLLPQKLPGIRVEDSILITNDLEESIKAADFICFIVPSQTLRSTAQRIGLIKLTHEPVLVNFAKGIENSTLKRMSEVLGEIIPPSAGIATISGPSHAEEVARSIPTAVVAASRDIDVARQVQNLLLTPSFRVYTSTDIIGVELAGSLKNIIALAAGMLDGLGLGDNTRGALLTRGLAEMVRMGKRLGSDPLTFSGLSGVGDLVTTCLSRHSRNRFVGEQIGKGRKLHDVLNHMSMVAEGVQTTQSGYDMARKYDVEMPITTQVYEVLFGEKSPADAIADLMTREAKPEDWS